MTIMFGMNTTGYMQYQAAYLLLYPKFDCFTADSSGVFNVPVEDGSDDYKKRCIPSYFCKHQDEIKWTVDQSDHISLNNWMQSYDLICTDSAIIGLFGTMFFTGFAIFSPILPSLSDKYGRKWFFVGCLTINILVFSTILLLPSGINPATTKADQDSNQKYMIVLIVLWFISGSQTAGRMAIGYNYFVEFAPVGAHDYMGTIWNISEGAIYIYITIYYRYVSKEWKPVFIFALILNLIVWSMVVFILPESPKWLFNKKKYNQCQKAFK